MEASVKTFGIGSRKDPRSFVVESVPQIDRVEHAYSILCKYIVDNRLEVGVELPSESEMAKQLNIGKGSLRQALRLAASKGLVKLSRGKRARIAKPSIEPITDLLSLTLNRSEGNNLVKVLEARELIECRIARLAATNATPSQIDQIKQKVIEMQQCLDDQHMFVQKDVEFHNLLCKAAGNIVYEILLAPLAEIFRSYITTMLPQVSIYEVQKCHEDIFHAIEVKDPDKAEQLMRKHLLMACEILGVKIDNS